MHRDGLSIRQIARQLEHGRDTVKRALIEATPLPFTRSKPVVYPKLGPFLATIDQIRVGSAEAAAHGRAHFQRLKDERG